MMDVKWQLKVRTPQKLNEKLNESLKISRIYKKICEKIYTCLAKNAQI